MDDVFDDDWIAMDDRVSGAGDPTSITIVTGFRWMQQLNASDNRISSSMPGAWVQGAADPTSMTTGFR